MATADELLDAPVQVSADQLLDQGGTATSDSLLDQADKSNLIQDTAGGVKETVKDLAGLPMKALRGYEAIGVGGAKLLSGSRPQEALQRASEATQPGFEPKGVAENVGYFVGGSIPLLLAPSGSLAVGASWAAKLIHTAKFGGLFGLGFSSLDTLEKKGTITMDDAEYIAKSTVMNAVFAVGAEIILGPVFARIFKRKGAIGKPEIGPGELPGEMPPGPPPPEYTPSAAARAARKKFSEPHAEANATDLDNLIEVKQKIEQHGVETLSPEAQASLDKINKEVDRLTKLDKTYTTKQMLKDMGQDTAEMTPAKAEDAITRLSGTRVAIIADGKVITGELGDTHLGLAQRNGFVSEGGVITPLGKAKGYKLENDGHTRLSDNKYMTRDEAGAWVNAAVPEGSAPYSESLSSEEMNPVHRGVTDTDIMDAGEVFFEDVKMTGDNFKKVKGGYEGNGKFYTRDEIVKKLFGGKAPPLESSEIRKAVGGVPSETPPIKLGSIKQKDFSKMSQDELRLEQMKLSTQRSKLWKDKYENLPGEAPDKVAAYQKDPLYQDFKARDEAIHKLLKEKGQEGYVAPKEEPIPNERIKKQRDYQKQLDNIQNKTSKLHDKRRNIFDKLAKDFENEGKNRSDAVKLAEQNPSVLGLEKEIAKHDKEFYKLKSEYDKFGTEYTDSVIEGPNVKFDYKDHDKISKTAGEIADFLEKNWTKEYEVAHDTEINPSKLKADLLKTSYISDEMRTDGFSEFIQYNKKEDVIKYYRNIEKNPKDLNEWLMQIGKALQGTINKSEAQSGSKIIDNVLEPKLKDLTPTLDTSTKGIIKGTPGQELDDLIAQNNLDLVADNVIEGYTNKEGKFLTKEEVLGPAEEPTSGTRNYFNKESKELSKYLEVGVKDTGTGKIHGDENNIGIHDSIMDDLKMDPDTKGPFEPGFIDKQTGKFIDRDEALKLIYSPEQLKARGKIGGLTGEELTSLQKFKVQERSRLINKWAEETAQAAKDLGYKTSDEALKWAEKSHHYLTDEYKLAFQNKFQSLMKNEPKGLNIKESIDPKTGVKIKIVQHKDAMNNWRLYDDPEDFGALEAAKDLVVAAKKEDGKIIKGKFAQSHENLPGGNLGIEDKLGFVDKLTGKFIDHSEAASYLGKDFQKKHDIDQVLGYTLYDLHKSYEYITNKFQSLMKNEPKVVERYSDIIPNYPPDFIPLDKDSIFFAPENKGYKGYGKQKTIHELDTSKIFKIKNSDEFIKSRNLLNEKLTKEEAFFVADNDPNLDLFKYNFNTLGELIKNNANSRLQIFQNRIKKILKKEGYSGIEYLGEDLENPNQFQIWDKSIIKNITSKPIVSATPIEVGESAPILKMSEMMDAFNKELPPTAGANPEVADVVDAVRDASIGKKPKIKLDAGAPPVKPPGTPPVAAGAPEPDPAKKIFQEITKADENVKIVIHANEVPTENQLKIKADTAKSATAAKLKVPASVIQSSPNLPGTEMAPAFIPEYISGSSNFRLGWYSRVVKQTRTVLEGMGNAGKELAARIGLVDDSASIRANNFLYSFDRFITQIPKKMREMAGMDLMDVLEGRKQSSNLLPSGMVEQVQKMFGSYADDAKAMDFWILRQDGTKVPWAERANFAPRMVKSEFIDGILREDGATLNRVKQYFLESKQVTSDYQASQKVTALRRRYMERRYGHLERAREYDLPPEFYDRQGFSVIPEYVRAASHRLEEVRQFGQHDVQVIQLLDRIAGEGHDAVLARQIFDRYTGAEVSDEVHSRLVQGIKNLVTGMSIQLPSTITQLGQVLTPIHRATSPDLGLGLAKAYGRAAAALIKSFTTLGKEQAARAGQGFESVATDFLLDTYGGVKRKPFGKFAEKSLEWSGFSGEDSFWRRYSALLGRSHIKNELIPRILKDANNKYAVTELRRLGLNPSIVRAQGGLSDFELNLATKRFADQTQGAPNVLNLPLWWTSPTGRFMTQFHSFSVVIGKENYLLAKDMIRTGNINRLISMGVGTPLVGIGISYLKEDMLGLKPNDYGFDKDTNNIIKWYMNGTSFGVMADLMLSLSKGRSAFTNAFVAPSLAIGSGLFYDTLAAVRGDKKAAKRVGQKIPVVGRVLFQ